MTAHVIVLCKYVEEEGFHIVVQGFMIQEELGKKAQVLTVDLTGVTVHLKHRQVILPVDLIGWRMLKITLILQL